MDQLKIVLSVVKKYQFWILCLVMLLSSLVCWWLAKTSLAGQFRTRQSTINIAFDSVKVLPNAPNKEVAEKVNEQNDLLKRGVYDAWETLYNEEKESNLFPTKQLGEDFKAQFEKIKLPKGELARPYREIYQRFIKECLPTLRASIDARRPKEEAESGDHAASPPGSGMGMGMGGKVGGGAPGTPGADVEWTGVVDWDENGDYARLVRRFDWERTPSTFAIVMAQEDLWVYEALLRVIKNTNEGATRPANAAVKRIDSLDIGRDAAVDWKAAEASVFTGKGSAAGGSSGGPGGGGDNLSDSKLVELALRGRQGPAAARIRRVSVRQTSLRRVHDDACLYEVGDGWTAPAATLGRVRQLAHAYRGPTHSDSERTKPADRS